MGQSAVSHNNYQLLKFREQYLYVKKEENKTFGPICLWQSFDSRHKAFTRTFMTLDKEKWIQIQIQCRQRMKHYHPNLIQMIGYCDSYSGYLQGSVYKVEVFFQYFIYDLEKEINYRRLKEAIFMEAEIWLVMLQITKTLVYLHSNDINHDDIQPSNIFFSSQGIVKLMVLEPNGRIVNLENRVGKMHSSLLKQTLFILKQLGNNNSYSNQTTDMFCLGISMLQMMTLDSMMDIYENSNLKELYLARIIDIISFQNFYSSSLINLIRKLIVKDPSNRISSFMLLVTLMKHEGEILNDQAFTIEGEKPSPNFNKISIFSPTSINKLDAYDNGFQSQFSLQGHQVTKAFLIPPSRKLSHIVRKPSTIGLSLKTPTNRLSTINGLSPTNRLTPTNKLSPMNKSGIQYRESFQFETQ